MRKSSKEENFNAAALPGGIEAQEARGQQELIQSEELPATCRPSWEAAEKLGIKKTGKAAGDPLFVCAELPKGWKKVSTDHSMWSKIIDEKGVERASIFYKAAFYDRDAFMTLVQAKK